MDIVPSLRSMAAASEDRDARLWEGAADEIEQLRGALQECLSAFEHYEKQGPGSIDLSPYAEGIRKLLTETALKPSE